MSPLFHFIGIPDYVTFRRYNQELDENSLLVNHGETRIYTEEIFERQRYTDIIKEWILF